jgi:hypothetical protein
MNHLIYRADLPRDNFDLSASAHVRGGNTLFSVPTCGMVELLRLCVLNVKRISSNWQKKINPALTELIFRVLPRQIRQFSA